MKRVKLQLELMLYSVTLDVRPDQLRQVAALLSRRDMRAEGIMQRMIWLMQRVRGFQLKRT